MCHRKGIDGNDLAALLFIVMMATIVFFLASASCRESRGAEWSHVYLPARHTLPGPIYCPDGFCPIQLRPIRRPMVPVRPPVAAVAPYQATPPAAHHAAVVRIEAGSGRVRFAGTGTLITADGLILTAAHVVEGHALATATWSNGYTSSGAIICFDRVADIAVVKVTPPRGAVVIPLSETWPTPGEAVELCGYGGGANRLRHWSARVNGYELNLKSGIRHSLSVASQTISGDSGGPIIYKGKLVAVLWGGPTAGKFGPMTATHGTYCAQIRHILQGCGCFPRVRKIPQIVRPVEPPAAVSPAILPAQPQPQKTPPVIDYQRLLNMMAADRRFQPRKAATIDRQALLDELVKKLPPVVIEMYDTNGRLRKRQSKPLGDAIIFQRVPAR